MNRKLPWDVVGIVICGVAGVLAGVRLVWLVRLRPISPRASLNHVPGMEFGIRGPDLLILGIVVTGILASCVAWRIGRDRVASVALLLAGVLTSSLTVWRFVALTGGDGRWTSYFLGPGVYVTLGGGAMLVVAGGLLWSVGDDSIAETEREEAASTAGGRSSLAVPLSVSGVAVAGVAVGTWMEWLVPIPTATRTAIPVTGAGISVLDGALIAVVCAGILASLAVSTRLDRPSVGGLLAFLSGLPPLLVPLWRHVTATELSRTFNSDCLVAPGTYVTLLAGALLVVAGALLVRSGDYTGYRRTRRPRRVTTVRTRPLRAVPWGASAVAVSGVAYVVAGTKLYWLVSVPDTTVGSPGYHPWLEIGTVGSNEFLLGFVVVGVLISLGVSTLSRRRYLGARLLLATGVVSLALTGRRLVAATGIDGMALDAYFVGPGVYVTLGGGMLLAAAGAILHCIRPVLPASEQREPGSESDPPSSDLS